jgi:hypothetical protein
MQPVDNFSTDVNHLLQAKNLALCRTVLLSLNPIRGSGDTDLVLVRLFLKAQHWAFGGVGKTGRNNIGDDEGIQCDVGKASGGASQCVPLPPSRSAADGRKAPGVNLEVRGGGRGPCWGATLDGIVSRNTVRCFGVPPPTATAGTCSAPRRAPVGAC